MECGSSLVCLLKGARFPISAEIESAQDILPYTRLECLRFTWVGHTILSVVHEPSGLEPRGATSRAGSSPGLDSARADSIPLASGSDRGPRASWRFLGRFLAARVQVWAGLEPRVQGCHELSRLESRSRLGSSLLVNNTNYTICCNVAADC